MKCNWDEKRECNNGMLCGLCKYQPADEDKVNGKKEPVEIDWKIDYGMNMPYCPSCGEMSYSTERCVFCGQKFKEASKEKKPKQNKKEYTGGRLSENGSIECEKCGRSDGLTLKSHAHGATFFDYEYSCECGNTVRCRTFLGEFE